MPEYNPVNNQEAGFLSSAYSKYKRAIAPTLPNPNQGRPGGLTGGYALRSLTSPASPTVNTPVASSTVNAPTSPVVSSGGGGGVSSGGGINSATPILPTATTNLPTEPAVPSPEADPTYQLQVSELAKALADYDAQSNLSRSQFNSTYDEGLRKMGWDSQRGQFDRGNTRGLYGQAADTNANDFASRGLRWSGLFGKADSDVLNEFLDRKTDLDTEKQQYADTQEVARTTYANQNELAKEAARREAISRLVTQLGVF